MFNDLFPRSSMTGEFASFISDVFVVLRVEMSSISLWFSQMLIMPQGNILNQGKIGLPKNEAPPESLPKHYCQTEKNEKIRIPRYTNVIMRWIRHNLLLGYGILTVSFPPSLPSHCTVDQHLKKTCTIKNGNLQCIIDSFVRKELKINRIYKHFTKCCRNNILLVNLHHRQRCFTLLQCQSVRTFESEV